MKDRIRKIMESQHMTQQVFANFIELSPASLSSIFNGRTRPTLNIVEAIKKKFPTISVDWLLFGSGSMYAANDGSSTDSAPQGLAVDSPEPTLDFGDATLSQPTFVPTPSPQISQPRTLMMDAKNIDKKPRSITEIRIFYDDQTWETFVPKK